MSTRISFNQINQNVLNRLFQNYNKLESIQEELSTGKKINRPSDDPVATTNTMQLKSEVDRLDTYQRNIDDGLAYLGTVDTTLSTGNSLYQNLRERAIQASNDTNSAESRTFIGQEVRGMFDQMVALANTSFKGQYVFSGNNTQVPPYEMRQGQSHVSWAPPALSGDMDLQLATLNTPIQIIDKNVDDSLDTVTKDANAKYIVPGTLKIAGLTEGTDYTVDYVKGTITFLTTNASNLSAVPGFNIDYNWLRRNEKDLDGINNREIEENVSARINTTATEVFGSDQETNSWEAMINLMEGTLNNKPDKIRTSLDQIDKSLNRQLSAQSMNGSRVQRLESTKDRNDNRTVYTTQLQSQTEDVDFAKAVSEFTLQQSVYQASLQMGAQAIQKTLANFL